jgi:hypothetical protein
MFASADPALPDVVGSEATDFPVRSFALVILLAELPATGSPDGHEFGEGGLPTLFEWGHNLISGAEGFINVSITDTIYRDQKKKARPISYAPNFLVLRP